MLRYALIFLIIALVAGYFGFAGDLSATAMLIAKVLFVLFLILFVIGLIRGKKG